MRTTKVCRNMLKHVSHVFGTRTSTSCLLRCGLSVETRRTLVTKITSIPQFEKAISEAPAGKHVMVDYNSQSCDSHKPTSSVFEKISDACGDMLFFSVDCDAMSDLAAQRGIDTLPTFETIRDGKVLERVSGEAVTKFTERVTDEKHILETISNFTPLMNASMEGDTTTVKQLLEAGAEQTTFEGRTPLGCACAFGHTEVAGILLENSKEHLNAKYSDGSTPLILATMRYNEDVVRLLTAEPSLDVDAQNNDGYSALYIAAHNGIESAVKLLLKVGANTELAADSGITPLMAASKNGHSEVVKMLPANGKDVNGYTTLHIAAYNGFGDVTRALIAHPSLDVNAKDSEGLTPLIMAACMGHMEVVSALLAHSSVNVNASHTETGATALHYAAERGNEEVVRALVTHPSLDVNVKCKEGRTALRAAAQKGHESIVETLLEAGAKVEDTSGKTKNI